MEALEARIGRLLVAMTYVSVGLILIGVLLMIVHGISPLDAAPPFDLRAIPSQMLALQATGFLWAGLLLVLATPISRVVVAAWGYARRGDRLHGRDLHRGPPRHRDRHRHRDRGGGLNVDLLDPRDRLRRDPRRRGALHQRHRVVRAQAGPRRGGRRLGPGRGRHGPARDDDPDHRDPVRLGEGSAEIGVGAILGAPFMLSTLAMFVTGVAVLVVARRATTGDTMQVDTHVLGHDTRYFASPTPSRSGRPSCRSIRSGSSDRRGVLIGIYIWYVKGHFEADPDVDADDLAPLRFHRLDPTAHRADPAVPRLRIVSVQVVVALGPHHHRRHRLRERRRAPSRSLGVDEVLLALVIAPIATELPEKFNSVIWVRGGKDTLAMGNITGAMVFQATIPTVVALVFAPTVGRRRGFLHRLRLGRHRLPLHRRDLHPDGPRGRLRGRGLLVGGAVTCSTWRSCWASSPARPAETALRDRALLYSADRTPTVDRGARTAASAGSRAAMITEKPTDTPATGAHHAPKPGVIDDLICYFEGDFVAMRDAKVSIMTHAFMYGTATFEGIRGYWNADRASSTA